MPRFAAFHRQLRELLHMRTRKETPRQYGVRERVDSSLPDEHSCRLKIGDGHQFAAETETYRHPSNAI